jgi:hypothetical protein
VGLAEVDAEITMGKVEGGKVGIDETGIDGEELGDEQRIVSGS